MEGKREKRKRWEEIIASGKTPLVYEKWKAEDEAALDPLKEEGVSIALSRLKD